MSIIFFFLVLSWQSLKVNTMSVEVNDGLKILSHDYSIVSLEPSRAVLARDPNASLPISFTICSTIMAPHVFPRQDLVFAYLMDRFENVLVQILMQVQTTVKGGIVTKYDYKKQWKDPKNSDSKEFYGFSQQWIKLCAAVNRTSGLYQVVADGIVVENRILSQDVLKAMPTDLSGKIVLGNPKNLYKNPSENMVTNLNIFSTAHTVKVMRQNTGGESCIEDGDYLAWSDMEWTLYGQTVIETVTDSEPCSGDPSSIVYPAFMGQSTCIKLCESLGSRLPSIVTSREWANLEKGVGRFDNYFAIWTAIDDKEIEDQWRDHYTGQVMVNHSNVFFPGAPNRGRDENCAIIYNRGGLIRLDDDYCELPAMCMCENNPELFLRLRGLCKGSAIETHYRPKGGRFDINQFRIIGLHSSIDHSDVSGLWELSVAKSNVKAISRAPKSSFTLGKHNWTVLMDRGCNRNSESDSYTMELKMSGCKDGQHVGLFDMLR